ncbi:MAG: hydrogenase expression/formation protein HypE [Bdellovibrionaceae bacterium]|jgi:hydrogenase expression/formation protein HypE|nr:hydrogenase expression/formation protein HypE [Pseudobdellovibrionaceae bacterium]
MSQHIHMNHGSGGHPFEALLKKIILPAFDNPYLNQLTDGALLESVEGRLVMTTDAHVVSPRIFPGGSLGKLAFCGTVNDLAVMGAKPLYLSLSLIIEEGFSLEELKLHIGHMAKLSKQCSIPIVAGDTKVVERGKGDGLFMTTSGVGVIENPELYPQPKNISPGDMILINGPIGNHGISVLAARENLDFQSEVVSDCAPLQDLILPLWKRFPEIRCMRDPTRGGVAAVANELASQCELEMELFEQKIPVEKSVRSACELMGFDPLLLANEGKVIIFAPEKSVHAILDAMRSHELGTESEIIGQVHKGPRPLVRSTTALGGSRLIPWPSGEQLPRIC